MSNNKYVCIHGHFYQPPRENPWLSQVEIQDSAFPFHDWNQRITSECYSRNATARILDEVGKIVDIVNNYSRISFNFGPTLLQWLKTHEPEVYKSILDADHESIKRFSGHGSAIAQSYNHIIMPLANKRDIETQVIWGIKDFEYRFKRRPEGMWLSETAVNTHTLEIMAKHGIKFTVLSPYQAKSIRKIGNKNWHEVTGGLVDPRMPYQYNMPSGKSICLFFYDGPVSQGIAFERLLNNGKAFAYRLTGQLDGNTAHPQLMHIATDGETYGHHHRFGEMALSFCLDYIDKGNKADITIYGEYLEKFPPSYEAQILENTAWSSTPNLERWSENGGGNTGGNPDWHQKWRKPLRASFDWLRDEMIKLYEREMGKLTEHPWAVRDKYIEVVLDRTEDNVANFIEKHTRCPLNEEEKVKFLKLLEIQHHTMLMYTSCGWFFDEVTGIETIQDIMYAARAIQLAEDLTSKNYEGRFLELLAKCPSNVAEFEHAAAAYEKHIKPAIVDMHRVGAHYAVSSLFEDYTDDTKMYCFYVEAIHRTYKQAGKYRLAVGKAAFKSEVTWEKQAISYAVLHLGDHHLFGGVREATDDHSFQEMLNEVQDAFDKSRVHDVVVLIDKFFGTHNYSFWHLFKDEQQKIVKQVTSQTMQSVESTFGQIYENNYSLMQAMTELNIDAPQALKFCSDFSVNAQILKILQNETVDYRELRSISETVERLNVNIDKVSLCFQAEQKINKQILAIKHDPSDENKVKALVRFLTATKPLRLNPDLWFAQNIAFRIHQKLQKNPDSENFFNQDDFQSHKELLDLLSIKISPDQQLVIT